jgi:hypothetical protein
MLKRCLYYLLSVVVCSCATYGPAPIGGAQDVTPPAFIGSIPPNATTNFNAKQVRLNFNEYIQLKNASDIFISPQVKGISYSANLKQVRIDITDTLKTDVTYTVNFRKSLADINESNPIKNFQYYFSLGNSIDTAYLSATILDAYTLEPMPEVSILLFTENKDSLYLVKEPQYIGVTDSSGTFIVNHIKEGCYFVYAIAEKTKNYSIEANEEKIAYSNECLQTVMGNIDIAMVVEDSADVFIDSDVFDTIFDTVSEMADVYNNAALDLNLLLLYQDKEPKQFLKDGTFDKRGIISLKFNYPIIDTLLSIFIADTVNNITIVAENKMSATVYVKEMDVTEALVTVNYDVYSDTLDLLLNERQIKATDTTSFRYTISNNKDKLLPGDSIIFNFNLPLFHYLGSPQLPFIAIGEEDTLTGFVEWEQTSPTSAKIVYPWQSEYRYRVMVPRCTFSDFYDRTIDTSYLTLSALSLDIFGELGMEISGLVSGKYFLQILDAKNVMVKQVPVNGDGIYEIKFISPGEYSVWLFEDKNEDGIWTAGDFYGGRSQPEIRWRYNKKIRIEADWRIEEKWQF